MSNAKTSKTRAAANHSRRMRAGKTLTWIVGTTATECAIHDTPCPFCGLRAIVALPEAIRAQQPDDTTAVCHPSLGGCNHGFATNVAHV